MQYTYMRFPGFKDKALTLSYDDGVIYDEKLIEIMSKYGLKGTFNICSGLMSGGAKLSEEQAFKLYSESGNEVAVHGRHHLSLAAVSPAVATADVINDRIALEALFGKIITGMAYANGSYDDNVVEILKNCGIQYARTTISTEKFDLPDNWLKLPATCHHKNPRLMELARSFAETPQSTNYWGRKPKLFYLWGHSYEFNNDNNWHIIEDFAEYIGNRQDIWYATNIEICRYVKAYESLVFSADESLVYNGSILDVYINYRDINFRDKEILIPAGQTVKIK
ncbi:MAG: polysaccharide deacetylase family protein [Clostridia bacterium]|nr:polysaccharide deacetylase family protein [Clostridia bacterium]